MAHLHLLATGKDSNLFIGNLSSTLHFNYSIDRVGCQNMHVYVTNDEALTNSDWCIDKYNQIWKVENHKLVAFDNNGIKRFSTDNVSGHECSKIILTTDQDLIKAGVQAIPDEFLEWFVKNPSCEFVEIKPLLSNNGRALFGYKIIIPKEEHTTILTANAPLRPPVNLLCGDAASGIEPVRISVNKYFDEQSTSAEARLQSAIALLKQTTEYEVLDSFKEKVKQLEIE